MTGRLFVAAGAVSLALGLGACSFHPLFARSDSSVGGQQVFHSIYVDPIVAERAGFELRDSLLNLLQGASRQNDARYRLKVTLKQTIEGTGVQSNGDITRYTYTMTAEYELSNIHTGAEITKGSETSVTAYDVVASPYSTLVAQQDAQKSSARDIADRIRIDLGVYFLKHTGA